MSLSDPSAVTDPNASLAALRAELDGLDDAIHGLLRQRAAVVARVAQSKAGVALRPGREAAILRRLLAAHQGALPPVALVRIWRELFAATTLMQGAFTISVCESDRERTMTACAREHFGVGTALHSFNSPSQAIGEVSNGIATAAVLPMPSEEGGQLGSWWTALLSRSQPRIHIVARLPFWSPRCEGAPMVDALVVTAEPPDPSGHDRTLIGLEMPADASRARLNAALTALGLPARQMLQHRQPGAADMLVEVDGFLSEDDARLADLPSVLRPPVVLGAYACPL
jgi:chorismate mutase